MILEAVFAIALDGDTLKMEIRGSDTIQVGQERIRLWGIQAAEMQTCLPLLPCKAREAKRELQKLVAQGVVCHVWTRDRYGRHVGQCYVKGEDVAWKLVRSGLAKDWPKYSKGYYK